MNYRILYIFALMDCPNSDSIVCFDRRRNQSFNGSKGASSLLIVRESLFLRITLYFLFMQFRPKNFAKPEQVKTEEPGPSSAGAVAVKQEPVSPRAQPRKSPQNRTHRRHREVTQDTVTFGGGIGGVLVFSSPCIHGQCAHLLAFVVCSCVKGASPHRDQRKR